MRMSTAFEANSGVQPPLTQARGVRLRAVVPSDVPFLYGLAADPSSGFRWMYRGTSPSPVDFEASLWRGVFAQFIVERAATNGPIGLVTSFNAKPHDRHVQFAAVSACPGSADPSMMIGIGLFLACLVDVGRFRKVYFEAFEFNLAQYASVANHVLLEGELREHAFYRDRYWDMSIFAIYPSVVEEFKAAYPHHLAEDDVESVGHRSGEVLLGGRQMNEGFAT